MIDLSNSYLAFSNLGGQGGKAGAFGPNTPQTPQGIWLHRVGVDQNTGRPFDLFITNLTAYEAYETDRNGLNGRFGDGRFGVVNLKAPTGSHC